MYWMGSRFSRWFLVVGISMLSHFFIWMGFVNSYSAKLFNPVHFNSQFHSGVYQFRILSIKGVELLYHFIKAKNLTLPMSGGNLYGAGFDPHLFTSIILYNGFFLLLLTGIILLLTEENRIRGSIKSRTMLALILVMICGISQFVLVLYDYSAWFFLLANLFLIIQYGETKNTKLLLVLACLFSVSVINRETAALSISSWAAYFIWKEGIRSKTAWIGSAIGAFIFLAIYTGLRVNAGTITITDGNLLYENFSQIKNLSGLLFSLMLFGLSLFFSTSKNRRLILLFHFFSLPYLYICIYSGILYEIRLYIPVFLVSLLLGRLRQMPKEVIKYAQ